MLLRPIRTPSLYRRPGSSRHLPACITRMSTSISAEIVLTRTFRRISAALNGHRNRRFRIGEFVSPVQIVSKPLRMRRIVLHPCGNPGSKFLRVKLSDHQATPAAQRRSKLRHHLLRDVNASAVLFVPGSRRCRLGRNLQAHHRKISGRLQHCWDQILQTPRISEYSQKHFTVPAFCIVAHRCVSPVLVLKPSQQPSIQFTASFCCGPVVLCGRTLRSVV